MAPDQTVVWNSGRQMVDMMIRNIRGKPVQPARQDQKTAAVYGDGIVIPILIIARIRVLEIMLHRKEHNPRPQLTIR